MGENVFEWNVKTQLSTTLKFASKLFRLLVMVRFGKSAGCLCV